MRLIELRVIVEFVHVVVVNGAKSDQGPSPGQVVSLGLELLGARQRTRSLDSGKPAGRFIRGYGWNLGDAGAVGEDGAIGQAGENSDLFGKSGDAGLKMEALEFQGCGGQLGVQEVDVGIDAGLGALLFNLDQLGSRIGLLASGFQFTIDGIELDVRCRGVEGNLLLGILEPLRCGVNVGMCRLAVLALRKAEHERLHRCASNRRLAGWKTVRVSKVGGDREIGDICVLRLGEGGLRLFQIGIGKLDGARIALGEVDHCCQGNLGGRENRRGHKRHPEENESREPARIVKHRQANCPDQCLASEPGLYS